MCLTLKFRTRQLARDARNQPLIAKKPFTVYKVLMENNKSPYQEYQYLPGVNLSTEKFTSTVEDDGYSDTKWHLKINQGLHAMATEQDAKKKRAELNKGISKHKIVEFIVPAGTPYFLSYDKKEVVSLKLNWKK
jgi:hypothetical protein